MVNLNAYPKKYLQLRDNLEQFDFCYEAGNIEDNKMKELRIRCCKCNNWITLGID